ncbi:MAG: hypothetical protein JNK79_16215 [Chitinophagaceae bacterium]|nr:hypothetical protein [Chitinophagaceae bacterium]
MKKLLFVLAIGAFVACNEGTTDESTSTDATSTVDTNTTAPVDTATAAPADTSATQADSSASK